VGGYRLLGRLGEGGQGVAFLAVGPAGSRAAVKLLPPTTDPQVRSRFLKEVADISGILAGSRPTSPAAETEQLRQMAGPAFTLPSVHRWAGAVTASSADRPKSGNTDGSGCADVYLHDPCTGR
jgi:hypothetical protein